MIELHLSLHSHRLLLPSEPNVLPSPSLVADFQSPHSTVSSPSSVISLLNLNEGLTLTLIVSGYLVVFRAGVLSQSELVE